MAFYTYFEEHESSPIESGNRSGNLAFRRIFLTTWGDRWNFLSELYTSGPFGLPASYSQFWPGVLADEFNVDRLINAPQSQVITDPNSQLLNHDTLAKITISYTPLDFGSLSDNQEQLPAGTYATYSQESNIEFVSIPARTMKWESDDELLPPDINSVVPQVVTSHEVVWNQVKDVPWITLSNMKGKVNESTFSLPGSPQSFTPKTLLFEGLGDETTLSLADQGNTRKLTLRFIEKAQHALETSTVGGASGSGTVYGWNHMLRPDTQAYDQPINADDDAPMFQVFDFNGLWSSTT